MRFSRQLISVLFTLVSYPAFAQNTTPIDVNVDTGSHTCTSIGQEKKVYKEVYAGDGRYFKDPQLSTISIFGAGSCEYVSDNSQQSIVTAKFKFIDADGDVELMDKPIKFIVRAFADCTMDPSKLTSRIGTECRFTAISKRGTQ